MPSQWETALLCNVISHWLGANLESALLPYGGRLWVQACGSSRLHMFEMLVQLQAKPAYYGICITTFVLVLIQNMTTTVLVMVQNMTTSDLVLGQNTGIILCMHPANERQHYNITSSLIGWAHAQNDPWDHDHICFGSAPKPAYYGICTTRTLCTEMRNVLMPTLSSLVSLGRCRDYKLWCQQSWHHDNSWYSANILLYKVTVRAILFELSKR